MPAFRNRRVPLAVTTTTQPIAMLERYRRLQPPRMGVQPPIAQRRWVTRRGRRADAAISGLSSAQRLQTRGGCMKQQTPLWIVG